MHWSGLRKMLPWRRPANPRHLIPSGSETCNPAARRLRGGTSRRCGPGRLRRDVSGAVDLRCRRGGTADRGRRPDLGHRRTADGELLCHRDFCSTRRTIWWVMPVRRSRSRRPGGATSSPRSSGTSSSGRRPSGSSACTARPPPPTPTASGPCSNWAATRRASCSASFPRRSRTTRPRRRDRVAVGRPVLPPHAAGPGAHALCAGPAPGHRARNDRHLWLPGAPGRRTERRRSSRCLAAVHGA